MLSEAIIVVYLIAAHFFLRCQMSTFWAFHNSFFPYDSFEVVDDKEELDLK